MSSEKITFPLLMAVYGTLRPGRGNNRVMGDSSHVGTGKTVDLHTLTASGIPFVKKDGGTHRVTVDVFSVPDQRHLDSIDGLEGHPRWYKREETPVELEDGEVVDAWLYFNEEERGSLVESGDYNDYTGR